MPASIESRTTSDHHHAATISDVAALAGVSIATVSRVINGTAVVSDTTASKVRQAITSLSFVPHAAARMLASKKTHTIGLILPEISGFYFDPLLRGIENGLRGKGYDLLVHSAVFREGRFEPQSVKLNEHNTDGILIFAASVSESEITRLYNIGFPVVLLHQSPQEDQAIPSVTIDNKAGAFELVNHLIDCHKCRHIGFLSGPAEQEDSYWREMGYREALSTHGLQINPELIAYGGFNIEDAQESVRSWIQSGAQLDAIFAGDDDSATGAITAIRHAGKSVPEDIAVVGFDDIYISQYLSPPLTTVRAPIEEVGFSAAQNLIQLIRHEPVKTITKLGTRLMIRRSCGCSGSMN
jgi:DNA-binding LacI/PurR family transcriptional regulator